MLSQVAEVAELDGAQDAATFRQMLRNTLAESLVPTAFSLFVKVNPSDGSVTLEPNGELPPGVVVGFELMKIPAGSFEVNFELVDNSKIFGNPAAIIFPRLSPGTGQPNQVISFGVPRLADDPKKTIANFVNALPQNNNPQSYAIVFTTQDPLLGELMLAPHDPTIVNDPNPGGV
ncbi:MAG TPA: hypothetical protein VF756_09590 [Thermoanaerobaculia bacterium]